MSTQFLTDGLTTTTTTLANNVETTIEPNDARNCANQKTSLHIQTPARSMHLLGLRPHIGQIFSNPDAQFCQISQTRFCAKKFCNDIHTLQLFHVDLKRFYRDITIYDNILFISVDKNVPVQLDKNGQTQVFNIYQKLFNLKWVFSSK